MLGAQLMAAFEYYCYCYVHVDAAENADEKLTAGGDIEGTCTCTCF